MALSSRRLIILGSASGIALSIGGVAVAMNSPDFFGDKKEKELISFSEARERYDAIFGKQLMNAEQIFGIKYDTKDVLRRTWDTAQIALSEHYRPKEEEFPKP